MKKSLSAILSLAMAFSMFSSVAMGAEAAKDSSSFSDLKDLDAATKAKFDALIAAGVYDGVSEGVFGLNDKMNRAQFAKVAALIFKLDVDTSLTTSTFSDVQSNDPANGYALPYIEALKAAGLTDGYAPGQYNPAGEVTKQELATFLVRGVGLESQVAGTPGVSDQTVSDWAKSYVALAIQKGIVTSGEDGTFGGTSAATRLQLVLASYEAQRVHAEVNKPAQVSVSQAKAIGYNRVEVSLNRDVDTEKAKLTLKKGSIEIPVSVKFADDKKSAVLTLTDQRLSAGTYTATLSGLEADSIEKASADFTAENEAVTKIDFLNANDTVALSTKSVVKIKASNQYGENASFSAGAYTVHAGSGNDVYVKLTKNDAGELLLTLNTAIETAPGSGVNKYQAGISIIPVNIYHNDTRVTASKNFKMGTAPFISKLELGGVKYSNGKDAINAKGETASLDIVQYDQYGNQMPYDSVTDPANIRVTFNSYEPKIAWEVGDSNNDDIADLKVSLNGNVDKSGDYTFTVYNQAGTATATVSVKSSKVATKLEVGEMDDVIAAGDDEAFVPLVGYDANGNKLSLDELVDQENVDRISFNVSGANVDRIQTAGKHKGKVRLVNISDNPKSIVSLTAIIATPNANSVVTKTFTVADVRIPDRFKVATEPAKKLVAGAESKFKYIILDQYGKELKTSRLVDAAGNKTTTPGTGVAEYQVSVTLATYDGSIVALDNSDVGFPVNLNSVPEASRIAKVYDRTTGSTFADFNKEHKFTSTTSAAGDATITAVIQKRVGTSGSWTEISKLTRKIETVAADQTLTYSVENVGDIFNTQDNSATVTDVTYDTGAVLTSTVQRTAKSSKLAKEIKLTAIDAAGNKVALPHTIKNITSSNVAAARVELGTGVDAGKAYVIGNKVGAATLNVQYETNKGETVVRSVNVNVKNDAVSAVTFTADKTTRTKSQALNTPNAFELMELRATDNYGVEYKQEFTAGTPAYNDVQKYNHLLGVAFSISNVRGASGSAVGTVTVDQYGNLSIVGNVTSFEIVATTASGLTVSTAVSN